MSSSHPWTHSAYHIAAVANFTAAVAAEVRRQEDGYDETAQTLRVQRELSDEAFIEEQRTRYRGSYQMFTEVVDNHLADSQKLLSEELEGLQDAYPLGYEGVDPTGALGVYSLRAALLRHIERIEAERRKTAVAAGDGTCAAQFTQVGWARPPTLMKTDVEGTNNDRNSSKNNNSGNDNSVAASLIKKETLSDGLCTNDKNVTIDASTGATQPLMPRPATSADSTEAAPSTAAPVAQVKEEDGTEKPSSAAVPSWAALKAETPKFASADVDNGAYLTPHPTAPGAPFPRYTSGVLSQSSSPATLSAAAGTEAAPSPLPPTLVVASGAALAVAHHPLKRKRHRSSTPSRQSPPLQNSATLESGGQAEPTQRQPAPEARSATSEREGRAMQLWRQLRPGQHHQAVSRPTAAMVKAVSLIAQNNLKQAQSRRVAWLRRVTELLTSGAATVFWTPNEDADDAPLADLFRVQTPTGFKKVTAKGETSAEELAVLRDCLTDELAQLAAMEKAHAQLVSELLQALEEENASPSQEPPAELTQDTQYGDAALKRARRSSMRAARSPRHTQRPAPRSRRSPSASTTAHAEVAADRPALLRCFLHHPRHLMNELADAWNADSEWSGTRPDNAVFENASTDVQMLSLPSRDDDAQAADVDAYLWPTELDKRIQHQLHCHTDLSDQRRRHYYLSLSQNTVQQLEEAVGEPIDTPHGNDNSNGGGGGGDAQRPPVFSVVPPKLDYCIVGLPNAGTGGWLYVHGRGEAVVATVNLS